ncbi:MAG TPA: alpha/beta fold hydrolase [Lacunisphaera sp.]|nr:alpha/beta fold hydrolase [Lacunisphaera sp.]
MRFGFIPGLIVLFLAAGLLRVPAAEPVVERGEIEGARYIVARPAVWNGRALLLAHGFRPEDQPLHAEIYETRPPVSDLLAQGWLVALTSYRRNGIVLQDAITDLDNLRRHILQEHGQPKAVYLMGESMGGAIATAMMETRSADYAGAVAIGAALQVESRERGFRLTRQPRGPILFLTNQTELAEPRAYVEATRKSPVAPVLWRVSRDGHVNVNATEKLTALAALVRWVEAGSPPPDGIDATAESAAGESAVEFAPDNRSATGRVADVHEVYGNLTLDFRPGDLARLEIEPGASFALEARDRVFRVLYGKSFDSVPRGEWVAFPDAEGRLAVAINFGHAAKTAGLKPGDPVKLGAIAARN